MPNHSPPGQIRPDLRILQKIAEDSYFVAGNGFDSYEVGTDLIVYHSTSAQAKQLIGLLRVTTKNPNNLQAQAILIHPQHKISNNLLVKERTDELTTADLIPAYQKATGYFLEEGRVVIRGEVKVEIGAMIQALQPIIYHGKIIDYDDFTPPIQMRVTKISRSGKTAQVALVRGQWPKTGTMIFKEKNKNIEKYIKYFSIFLFFVILYIGVSNLIFPERVPDDGEIIIPEKILTTIEKNIDRQNIDPIQTFTPTEISIIYAPEEEAYMVDAIEQFNQAYKDGNNPLTGELLAKDESSIHVIGTPGSSGEVAKGIAHKMGLQNCQFEWSIDEEWLSQKEWGSEGIFPPTIFSPSVHHWLALVNHCTGQTVFDSSEQGSPATARAPVVIAIWESRLEAIKAENGDKRIGWEELLEVLNSSNGWADYGIESGHETVYYGHTDPFVSSTALSTLISEFHAIASTNDEVGVLELDEVNDANVQQGVRDIEQLIRHYAPRNTEFINYIAQGPDYVDFVALEENDLIKINRGETNITPPEKLVALYPKEGTFWHDHPFAIPSWVSDEQRKAAKIFTDFIRSETVQEKVLASGFRPVIELEAASSLDPNINPIAPDLGVDPEQPTAILEAPEPQVIAAIQASWPNVKKRADVILAIDTSESMEGNKITQAQEAAQIFLQNMSDANRVGLIDFNDTAEELVSLDFIEGERDELRSRVGDLKAEGKTALYDAIVKAVNILKNSREPEDDRIQAVIVLSDGEDTGSENDIQQVLDLINESRNDRNPIVVIPIAYGYKPEQTNDLDCNSLGNKPEPDQVLQCIAQASATLVESGNPESIKELLKILSGYF